MIAKRGHHYHTCDQLPDERIRIFYNSLDTQSITFPLPDGQVFGYCNIDYCPFCGENLLEEYPSENREKDWN